MIGLIPRRVLPVLMYHRIGLRPTGDPNLWLSEKQFASQLDWLARQGYRSLSLDDAHAVFSSRRTPPRVVLLTIDDGFADSLARAATALEQAGMRAAVFVPAGLLGQQVELGHPGGDRTMVSAGRLVDGEGLRRWRDAGMDVGSHSLTHRDLRAADADTVRREAVESKRRLEAELDRPIRDFCYPFARHDAAARRQISAAGYRAAYAGEPPRDDLFAIPRMMVYPTDHGSRWRRKASGFYYWLSAWHQRLRRFMGN